MVCSWIAVSPKFFTSSERFGSRLGGLIGGLPSTAVIALFFIGLTQSPIIASQAAVFIPIVQGINSVFIVVYLLGVTRNFAASLVWALIVWFVLTSLLVFYRLQNGWVSIIGWLGLGLGSYLIVEKRLGIQSHSRQRVRYTAFHVGLRAIFGGTIIALAVLIGKLGGALYGGIFATFPAMFLSTLVITYHSGGVSFSKAVAKSLLVSGVINVPVYALAVRWLYPEWGLAWGTIAAFTLALGSGYLTYRFMRLKMD